MTQIKFYAPVKEMNGEFEKGSGIIMRKKKIPRTEWKSPERRSSGIIQARKSARLREESA